MRDFCWFFALRYGGWWCNKKRKIVQKSLRSYRPATLLLGGQYSAGLHAAPERHWLQQTTQQGVSNEQR